MKSSVYKGKEAELEASRYLLGNGYSIMQHNYRSGKSEVDIIAKKGDTLVFVEVKARSNLKFGYPEASLSKAQERRIVDAAEEYTFDQKWEGNIRFDVISIDPETGLQHFEDAFY